MQPHQRHFIEFLIQNKALQFGEFTLKSGRLCPYFFNLSVFNSGAALVELGRFYTETLIATEWSYDLLFGPAYKGIPLVCATVMTLYESYQKNVPYCFNRKETKDHGEAGMIVGAPLQGRVILLDDVISAGTTIRETANLMKFYEAQLIGILIAFDRQERGQGSRLAIHEIAETLNTPIQSIITLQDLLIYLHMDDTLREWIKPIEQYQTQYGSSETGRSSDL